MQAAQLESQRTGSAAAFLVHANRWAISGESRLGIDRHGQGSKSKLHRQRPPTI
jgi:hypothetical protein